MADNGFRSYRGRDGHPRDAAALSTQGGADPLAELARLIGQSDPRSGSQRSAPHGEAYEEPQRVSQLEWSAGDQEYADPPPRGSTQYAQPGLAEPDHSYTPNGHPWVHDDGYDEDVTHEREHAALAPAYHDAHDPHAGSGI